MRIFTLPPTVGSSPEPNFYDSLQKVRLRQQLEMYSLGEHTISTFHLNHIILHVDYQCMLMFSS